MPQETNIISLKLNGNETPTLGIGDEKWIRMNPPVRVCFLEGQEAEAGYSAIHEEEDRCNALADFMGAEGTRIQVKDLWRRVDESTMRIDRNVKIVAAGNSAGIRVEFCAETSVPGTGGLDDWEFFIPGALYNKNDTNHDGVEDYLGTYWQEFRDDRLPSLAVLGFVPSRGRYVALARCDRPAFDTGIGPDKIVARHFVQATDIGSLGLAPVEKQPGQIWLRASYPFTEKYTFCLNTRREGWAAYLENRVGREFQVSYQLTIGRARSLTDAMWELTRRQMLALGTKAEKPSVPVEDILSHRLSLTQSYYRKWTPEENRKEPAGYMVHFSPRSGKTQGTLLEFGFAGAQPLLAYVSLRYGYLKKLPLWIARARTVIDFFVNHCQLENGFSQGIYDVAKQDFVYWFTGILLPFQYAQDEKELRRLVGAQITESLAPVARQLRNIQGNYIRTMCESIYPTLLAYKLERQHGHSHEHWRTAAERFGAFLRQTQGEDGSWFRAYDTSGKGLESPAEWFGSSDTEKKSGTVFPIEVLVQLHELTGDTGYLAAAERAANFILLTYVESVEYVGGLNDTTHIKSVKIDAIGVMFAMRSLLKIFEATGNRSYLDGALKAAKVLASWVYLWDVPFPADSLLGSAGFKSTGWAVCDVIPAGSYVDDELPEFIGDLIRIAQLTGEKGLFDVAEIAHYGMQGAVSTPEQMLGYIAPGIQCEGLMTAYWLSDPDSTEFSGAANKVKGQDNDTCNGLINGQAAYGYFDLHDKYRTADLDTIWRYVFKE